MNHQNNLSDSKIKPDIIIEYTKDIHSLLPVSVVYVRPETNILSYENSILKGITPYADVIYMANLNGRLFIRYALILDHYASQYRFAIIAKNEMSKFPEMIAQFQDYFSVNYDSAQIIGSFEALIKLQLTPEELFNLYVEQKNYLYFYGQSIKKINDYYVVNYNLPAIINKYNDQTNIFTILIRFKDSKYTFNHINKSISQEILKNHQLMMKTNMPDVKPGNLIKRAYHFSNNNIKSMFDMIDFVFNKDGSQIKLEETPLGHLLIENNINDAFIKNLKEHPITYIKTSGKKKLINIIEDDRSRNLTASMNLFKKLLI